ncbi:MAG: bifunctional (p)ppGpp synthetase/guanosine-3',5'-bis(diphosphate) 3'-pyrophosphohydrolase [Pseudomonadota bacterium]
MPDGDQGLTNGARAAEDADATSSAAASGASQEPAAGHHEQNAQARASGEPVETSASQSLKAPRLKPLTELRSDLVARVAIYDPEADLHMLGQAFDFGEDAHSAQKRHSGEPYFYHPVAVAGILTDLRVDPATVATALLHDTIEDTDATYDKIAKSFGHEIARLVDGVTKLTRIELKSEASKTAENFRKLILAMSKDVRVLLVKLADRLHNMRTLAAMPKPESRRRIAMETLEIYAPLAGRIGVHKIREQLEDLAFAEVNPEAFRSLVERLEVLEQDAGDAIVEVALVLKEKLSQHGIEADVTSRRKRPYSIWRKMAEKNVNFQELADIFAFRILVDDIKDCYAALGVLHRQWATIPGKFKDYISTPKPNNYRSIHTAIWGPRRGAQVQRIEVQIRTRQMHETAERGVAAHWRYKDVSKKSEGAASIEINRPDMNRSNDPYDWLQSVVKMLDHGDDADEFLEHTKLELFQDQVFCFTPKGRLIALPRGATPLDFAYALHTDIGDACVGAKINGRPAPLRTPLRNSDMVEILRSKDAPPAANWERIVVTGRARSAIRRRVKRIEREDYEKLGRNIAASAFTEENLEFTDKAVVQGAKKLKIGTPAQVFERIGRGDMTAAELLKAAYPGQRWRKLFSTVSPQQKPSVGPDDIAGGADAAAVVIEGLRPGVALHMAACCHPLPGDRIVGIATPGRGVVVHTIDCETLAKEDPPQHRWVDLKWRRDAAEALNAVARLKLTMRNAVGVLGEITTVIARYRGNIINIRMTTRSVDFFDLVVDVEVSDVRHLTEIIAALRASASVISVDRLRG